MTTDFWMCRFLTNLACLRISRGRGENFRAPKINEIMYFPIINMIIMPSVAILLAFQFGRGRGSLDTRLIAINLFFTQIRISSEDI